MTLDEAIKHAEEVADVCEFEARKCAKEHRQLAEWLKELKQLKKQTSSGREAHLENALQA